MTRYRIARQADADLDELTEYLAARGPEWIIRVLDGLHEAFKLLADNPEIGTDCGDLRPNLQVFPGRGAAHSYLIFYYAIPNGIEVSTIIHGARDYPAVFESGNR